MRQYNKLTATKITYNVASPIPTIQYRKLKNIKGANSIKGSSLVIFDI